MVNQEIILKYQGLMSFEIIGALLNRLKDETESRGIGITQYKKLLALMIEALENVFKYNENFEHESGLFPNFFPRFTIERINNDFIISSANPILNTDIDRLLKHVDHINSLDKDGLKKLFRETLMNGRFSPKGGAGLGFIEMAKISGNKIDYSFTPINEKFSYYHYTLQVTNAEMTVTT